MMKVYAHEISAQCPSGTPWAVFDTDTGNIVACLIDQQTARQHQALINNSVDIAAGLGVPQDLPGVTPATGMAASAPATADPMAPGGAQPGYVVVGSGTSVTSGPQIHAGAGWTTGVQPGAPIPRHAVTDGELETRAISIEASDLEVRSDAGGMHFRGYAAVFNMDSHPLPFIETIVPGAFSRSLSGSDGRDIKMFLNHDPGKLLATRKAGTLRLTEDSRGLLVDSDLPNTSDGRDAAELIRRGDIDNMSFTFKKVRDSWSDDGSRRSLNELKLFEVSPMTEWAAYSQTTASVRSLELLGRQVSAPVTDLSVALRKLTGASRLTPDEAHLIARVAAALAASTSPEAPVRLATTSVAKARLALLARA